MADTERTKAELLAIFADSQPAGSIDPQDMRDYVVTTDIVNTRFSTGLIDGGIITVNVDTAKVNISAGEGFYTDNFTDPTNPVRIKVAWSDFIAEDVLNLATMPFTVFALNLSSGTAVVVKQNQFYTVEQRRDFVILALALHNSGTVIEAIVSQYTWSMDVQQTVYDLGDAIGQINISGGNIYSGNSDLTVSKSAGSSFFIGANYPISKKVPNTTTDLEQDPVPFLLYTHRDGSGGFIGGAPVGGIDPTSFDDGSGTLATVGNNQFSIQRLHWLPEIFATFVQYGQTEYANLDAAVEAINTEDFEGDPNLVFGFRAWLVVKKETNNLASAVLSGDAKFLSASKFGDVLRT